VVNESIRDSLINAYIAQNPDVSVISPSIIQGLVDNYATNKPIITDIENTANILSQHESINIDDAPQDIVGKDRIKWAKSNIKDPITGLTLGEYMENKGYGDEFSDYYEANKIFKSNIQGYKSSLRDDIRNFSGTKYDLVKFIKNNEAVRNFFGVSDEEISAILNDFSRIKEMFDKIEVGDPSSPSSVFEKEAAKSIILKEMGTNRDLNKFLGFTLGYDDYMKSKKDEPWKWGFE
tara:strand:+ start:614 stop:1318 length:705 start_codon:yes stop_codon:yes gene_type:complete